GCGAGKARPVWPAPIPEPPCNGPGSRHRKSGPDAPTGATGRIFQAAQNPASSVIVMWLTPYRTPRRTVGPSNRQAGDSEGVAGDGKNFTGRFCEWRLADNEEARNRR